MPADIQYYDEDHGGSENAMYSFVSLMAFGAVLGSRNFTGFGPSVRFAGTTSIPSISLEESNLIMENAILSNALRNGEVTALSRVLSAADRAILDDAAAQRMLSQGITSAGCIFFPSGL